VSKDGVEVGRLGWRKSTHSNNPDDCVEVAPLAGGGWAVRDSKDPASPVLSFNASEWAAFLAGAKAGEFDL
jgi:uncharacterized protein DUF397